MRLWLTACFLSLFLIGAEAHIASGLGGIVIDPSGAAVPKAAVELSSAQTGSTRTTAFGRYLGTANTPRVMQFGARYES